MVRARKVGASQDDSDSVQQDGMSGDTIHAQSTPMSQEKAVGNNPDLTMWCLILFLLSACVYTMTLYPTVPPGDCGELITVANHLGVAHPPGYPVFTIMGHIFARFVPFGNVAWRINLMSAMFGSSASVFLFLAGERLTKDPCSAFIAASAFAFSPLVWSYAIVAEVFSLNNCFCCALVYLTIRYTQTQEMSVIRLGALVVGIGSANQHTIVFYALPMTLWVLYVMCSSWSRKLGRRQGNSLFLECFKLGCFGLLGLSPYLYMVWAARNPIFGSWGATDTWDGFWLHFLRKEYGTFQLGGNTTGPGDNLDVRLWLYAEQTLIELTYVGTPLAAVGMIATLRHAVGRVLMVSYLSYVLIFHYLSNLPLDNLHRGVTARFWPQATVIVCLWLSAGVKQVLDIIGFPHMTTARLSLAIVVAALLVGMRFETLDQHDNWSVEQYGRAILDSMPAGALVLIKGDIIHNSVSYLQECEGYRTDVVTLSQPLMTWDWYVPNQAPHRPTVKWPEGAKLSPEGFSMFQFLEENRAKFQKKGIFACVGFVEDPTWQYGYRLAPWGLCDRVIRLDEEYPMTTWSKESKAALPTFSPPDMTKYAIDSWERVVFSDWWEARQKRGYHMLMHGIDPKIPSTEEAQKWIEKSLKVYRKLIKKYPESPLPPHFWKNLGVAASRLTSPDIVTFVGAFEKYLEVAEENESDIPQIETAVKTYKPHAEQLKKQQQIAKDDNQQ